MEKLVSTTFKILILSMLFMFLLDTSLLLVEIISIHTKVSNLTGIMQTEVARNNYMPDEMADTFVEFLEDIAKNSTIMTERDVDTNFYSSLTASDAGDYGDILDLNVYMTIHPSFAYYNPKRTATDMTWLKKGTPLDITLKYEYKVPCLRYLK
jgi:hypothetical protein